MSEWIKIRSFHLPSGVISRGGMIFTFCGRWAAKDAPSTDELPALEKTCESCFRNREIARTR